MDFPRAIPTKFSLTMITRIPSSPLSSATPSPRLHPLDGVAGPSRHSSMLSGDGRDDRSRTSSTIALTITAEDEESELTEEDGEDEGEEEEEEEEEELEDKPDRDVEEDGSLGLPVKRYLLSVSL